MSEVLVGSSASAADPRGAQTICRSAVVAGAVSYRQARRARRLSPTLVWAVPVLSEGVVTVDRGAARDHRRPQWCLSHQAISTYTPGTRKLALKVPGWHRQDGPPSQDPSRWSASPRRASAEVCVAGRPSGTGQERTWPWEPSTPQWSAALVERLHPYADVDRDRRQDVVALRRSSHREHRACPARAGPVPSPQSQSASSHSHAASTQRRRTCRCTSATWIALELASPTRTRACLVRQCLPRGRDAHRPTASDDLDLISR